MALLKRVARARTTRLLVLVVVVVAWGLFLRRQLTVLATYDWHAAPGWLVVGTLWSALYSTTMAGCWGMLLQQFDREVSLASTIRVWLQSVIVRYIPGNVWHIISRVALAEQLGVSGSAVLVSSTIEQAIMVVGAAALVVVLLPFLVGGVSVQPALLALVPLGLVLLHPRVFGALLAWVARKAKRPELAWRYRYLDLVKLVLGYMITFGCHGLALAAVLAALTPFPPAQLPAVIGIAALGWLIGYLSIITPSGLGVREAVLVAALGQHFPVAVAVIASILFRIVTMAGEFLAVVITRFAVQPKRETHGT